MYYVTKKCGHLLVLGIDFAATRCAKVKSCSNFLFQQAFGRCRIGPWLKIERVGQYGERRAAAELKR
jgi:hypothetical protein